MICVNIFICYAIFCISYLVTLKLLANNAISGLKSHILLYNGIPIHLVNLTWTVFKDWPKHSTHN